LLAVLVLVVIMAAIAAGAFERLRLSTAMAMNGAALDQARGYALGVEDLLALRIDDLANEDAYVTTLAGDWNGTERRIPLPGEGLATGTVRDGGNCFNLNSLVQGDVATTLVQRPAAIEQFVSLMKVLGLPEPTARRVAAGTADWVDSDAQTSPQGAEDGAYGGSEPAYRTGNTLLADPSELRRSDARNLPGAETLSLRASRRRHVADQRQHPSPPRRALARHVRSGQGPAGPGAGADRLAPAGRLAQHVRFLAQRRAGRARDERRSDVPAPAQNLLVHHRPLGPLRGCGDGGMGLG
jgi:hypothetical protein